MKPPGALQWAVGNPVVSLALVLGAVAAGIGWAGGHVNGLVALLVVMAGLVAERAAERVSRYRAWQREWALMDSGAPSARPASAASWKWPALISLWLLGAVLAGQGLGGPVAVWLFWAGSGVLLVGLVRRLMGGRPTRSNGRVIPVQVCLPIPRQSPSVEEAYGRLD